MDIIENSLKDYPERSLGVQELAKDLGLEIGEVEMQRLWDEVHTV